MPGEIATAYVRLRPISDTFRSEAQAQVGASLAGLNKSVVAAPTNQLRGQVDLAKASNVQLSAIASERAAANVKEASAQVRSLAAISAAYTRLAHNATLSSDEQRTAANLASEADAKRMVLMGRNVDSAKEHVGGFADTLKGLAATFGTTIGAIAGIDLVKSVISSAAEGQKASEAISANFGKAGDAIKKFATGAALNLGLSGASVETTAAKFGIAYRQIGISAPLAAQMTIGFEKLAGSIATIRGIDPAQVMSSLATAATGNTRALRTLGITIDQSQLKYAAFKAGITDTITNALTPAQKAETVYALATAKLGIYQQQAAAHSGDLANVQRKLSAEWSNAKDIIGTALLPILAKYGGRLATWLQQLEQSGKLQRDVNGAMKDASQIVGALKGVFDAFWPPVEHAVKAVGGLKNAFKLLLAGFVVFKAVKVLGAIEQIRADSDKASAGVRGITTALGLLNKWGPSSALLGFFKTIGGTVAGVVGGTTAAAAAEALLVARLSGSQGPNQLGKSGAPGTLLQKFLTAQTGKTIPAALGAESVKFHQGTITPDQFNAFLAAHPNLLRQWGVSVTTADLERNFTVTHTTAGQKPTSAIAATTNPTVTALKSGFAAIQDWRTRYTVALAGWKQEIALKKQYDIGNTIADRIFNSQVKAALASASQQLADAVKTGHQQVAAAVAAGRKLVSDQLASNANYIITGTLGLAAKVRAGQDQLTTAGKSAVSNLTSLTGTLNSALDKFLASRAGGGGGQTAGLTAAEARVRSLIAAGVPSAALLQQANALAGDVNQSSQGGTSKAVAQAKLALNAHISLLVQQAAKGQLTVKALGEKLNAYLAKSGITYKKLAHTVGTASATEIEKNIATIKAQLGQIALLPPKLRKQVLQSFGGAGSHVVNLGDLMKKIAADQKADTAKYNRGLQDRLKKLTADRHASATRIAKVRTAADARVAHAQKHLADVTATESLRVQQKHYQEAKAQTKLLTQLHKVAATTAATLKQIAGVQVNNTGFQNSKTQNPGHSAHTAARNAKHGLAGAG